MLKSLLLLSLSAFSAFAAIEVSNYLFSSE